MGGAHRGGETCGCRKRDKARGYRTRSGWPGPSWGPSLPGCAGLEPAAARAPRQAGPFRPCAAAARATLAPAGQTPVRRLPPGVRGHSPGGPPRSRRGPCAACRSAPARDAPRPPPPPPPVWPHPPGRGQSGGEANRSAGGGSRKAANEHCCTNKLARLDLVTRTNPGATLELVLQIVLRRADRPELQVVCERKHTFDSRPSPCQRAGGIPWETRLVFQDDGEQIPRILHRPRTRQGAFHPV